MAKRHEVPRPIKKAEYTIVFGTRQAEAWVYSIISASLKFETPIRDGAR
jgi:hypothetical protein